MYYPVTAAATLAPSLFLVWYFQLRDVHREPARVLWTTFALGVLSTVPVLVTVWIASPLIGDFDDPIQQAAFSAFFQAAIPEEFFKFVVLGAYAARHAEFDEPMDGIVYGVAASLGFATMENVLYVLDGGLGVATLRALTAVPGHAFTGAIMGYFVGISRFTDRGATKLLVLGYLIPTLLHGLYDMPLFALQGLGLGERELTTGESLFAIGGVLVTLATLGLEGFLALRLSKRLRVAQEVALAMVRQEHGEGLAAQTPLEASARQPATGGRRALGWSFVLGGGCAGSAGAVICALLVLGLVMGVEEEISIGEVLAGGMLVGVAPLVVGVLGFLRGVRILNARAPEGR